MIGSAITSLGTGDRLERLLDLLADPVDRLQVGAEDLDADLGADAGGEHVDAVDDRLRPDIAPAGHLHHAVHLVSTRSPLGPPLRGQRQQLPGEGLLQLLAEGDEGLQRRLVVSACRWAARVAASANAGDTPRRAALRAASSRPWRPRPSSSRAAQVNASTPRSNSSQLICLWMRSIHKAVRAGSTALSTSPANVLRSPPSDSTAALRTR